MRNRVAAGVVKAVLLTPEDGRMSVVQSEIKVEPNIGVLGDRHAGDRYVSEHEPELLAMGVPAGTHMATTRQVSLVSRFELDAIGKDMGLPAPMVAGLLSENIVVSHIAPLTKLLRPGDLLEFIRVPNDRHPCAVLSIEESIEPCMYPHRTIAEYFASGEGSFEPAMSFSDAARGRRGVVARRHYRPRRHYGGLAVVTGSLACRTA